MYKEKKPTLVDWLLLLVRLMPIVTIYLWPLLFRLIVGAAFFVTFGAFMYHLLDLE